MIPLRRSSSCLFIEPSARIERRLACPVAPDLLGDHAGGDPHGGGGSASDVRGQRDVVKLEQRGLRRRRLEPEGLQHRPADVARLQRLVEIVVVHHRPARGVDEIGAGLHAGELRRGQEALGLIGHAGMQADHVAALQQGVEIDLLDIVLAVLGRERDVGVAHQDAATERLQQAHDLGADMAVADQAHGHFRQLGVDLVEAVEIAAPHALPQRFMAGADQARLGQDGGDGELRDRRGVAAGRIDQLHLARLAGGDVDVDRPAARHRDQFQRRQTVQDVAVDRRQVVDQDFRAVDEAHDLVRLAHIFAQARQAAVDIAVAHRLIRPGQLHGAHVGIEAGYLGERVGEGRGLHELVADHRNLELVHQCILLRARSAQIGGIAWRAFT